MLTVTAGDTGMESCLMQALSVFMPAGVPCLYVQTGIRLRGSISAISCINSYLRKVSYVVGGRLPIPQAYVETPVVTGVRLDRRLLNQNHNRPAG
jgi:hypothetical protein